MKLAAVLAVILATLAAIPFASSPFAHATDDNNESALALLFSRAGKAQADELLARARAKADSYFTLYGKDVSFYLAAEMRTLIQQLHMQKRYEPTPLGPHRTASLPVVRGNMNERLVHDAVVNILAVLIVNEEQNQRKGFGSRSLRVGATIAGSFATTPFWSMNEFVALWGVLGYIVALSHLNEVKPSDAFLKSAAELGATRPHNKIALWLTRLIGGPVVYPALFAGSVIDKTRDLTRLALGLEDKILKTYLNELSSVLKPNGTISERSKTLLTLLIDVSSDVTSSANGCEDLLTSQKKILGYFSEIKIQKRLGSGNGDGG